MQKNTKVAVIDLGSNSFRLLIGFIKNNQLVQTDYLKEMVRQGDFDENGNITRDSFDRGLDCLARFRERLGTEAYYFKRAVATHTLREAANRSAFLKAAESTLGMNIEVISGKEEARLIFSGVTRTLPPSDQYRTAIDIGGRSTELVSGLGVEASIMESYSIGSVAATKLYFADGNINKSNFKQAKLGIITLLHHAEKRFNQYIHAGNVWGCSGTIGAVYAILEQLAASDKPEPQIAILHQGAKCISKQGMNYIRSQLLDAEQIDNIQFDGLKTERQPIFIGGFAILDALFDLFSLEHVFVADAALRQGIVYDAIEREDHIIDRRNNAIELIAKRFSTDKLQASIVQQTTHHLWQQINPVADNTLMNQVDHLKWAADLHEVGSIISHIGMHKHGAYILQNIDMIGFYQSEQLHLASLIQGSRGKLKTVEHLLDEHIYCQQLFCLRLAILLCHARRLPELKHIQAQRTHNYFTLRCHAEWAEQHPQSFYLLHEESKAWNKAEIVFSLTTFT